MISNKASNKITITTPENPVGLDGIELVEYATKDPDPLRKLFSNFGFKKLANHKTMKIELWRQGEINFLLNYEPGTFAAHFSDLHGPSICAVGWRCEDASAAIKAASERGARSYNDSLRTTFKTPAMYGIGDSIIYFVDKYGSHGSIYEAEFNFVSLEKSNTGFDFLLVDHLTNNVPKGEMKKWCDFYEKIFGFKERRHFDIRGQKTGLTSKVMRSADGKICVPINEPTEGKSQIQEYLEEYRGSGIQHLALLTADIVPSLIKTKERGIKFLETPDSYFDMIMQRVPNVTEPLDKLRQHRVLVDGDSKGYLLQIFSENIIGPIFFEIIQRKNHDGFGEGNFQALFDAMERDQMRRGVI